MVVTSTRDSIPFNNAASESDTETRRVTMSSDIPDWWLTQLKQTEELVWEMAERLPHMGLHDSRRRELWDQITALKTELADSMTESRVVPTNTDLLVFYSEAAIAAR